MDSKSLYLNQALLSLSKDLYKKYSTNEYSYRYINTNYLIFNEKCRIVSIFKDYLIYDDNTEFLRRFYKKIELNKRLNKILNFYETYSKIFPNYMILPESYYLYRNIRKKQKMIDAFNEIKREEEENKKYLNKNKNKKKNNNNNNIVFNSTIQESINNYQPSNINSIYMNSFEDSKISISILNKNSNKFYTPCDSFINTNSNLNTSRNFNNNNNLDYSITSLESILSNLNKNLDDSMIGNKKIKILNQDLLETPKKSVSKGKNHIHQQSALNNNRKFISYKNIELNKLNTAEKNISNNNSKSINKSKDIDVKNNNNNNNVNNNNINNKENNKIYPFISSLKMNLTNNVNYNNNNNNNNNNNENTNTNTIKIINNFNNIIINQNSQNNNNMVININNNYFNLNNNNNNIKNISNNNSKSINNDNNNNKIINNKSNTKNSNDKSPSLKNKPTHNKNNNSNTISTTFSKNKNIESNIKHKSIHSDIKIKKSLNFKSPNSKNLFYNLAKRPITTTIKKQTHIMPIYKNKIIENKIKKDQQQQQKKISLKKHNTVQSFNVNISASYHNNNSLAKNDNNNNINEVKNYNNNNNNNSNANKNNTNNNIININIKKNILNSYIPEKITSKDMKNRYKNFIEKNKIIRNSYDTSSKIHMFHKLHAQNNLSVNVNSSHKNNVDINLNSQRNLNEIKKKILSPKNNFKSNLSNKKKFESKTPIYNNINNNNMRFNLIKEAKLNNEERTKNLFKIFGFKKNDINNKNMKFIRK